MSAVREQVAIVVVTFNSRDLLPGLLASLPAGAADLSWQLVVADNDSADGTVAALQELAPDATIVEMGRNAGYAAGINAAVAAAGPHTAGLALNPDVRLGVGCIPELLRAVRDPGVGIAVPRLSDGTGKLILSMRREPTLSRALADAVVGAERAGRFRTLGEIVSEPRHYESETSTDWAEGSTQLISRACWQACGPWDDTFFLYSEEAEFDLRARDLGFATRYVPTAHAVHLEGDSARSPRLWALLMLNRVRLFRLRNGLFRAIPFWAATLIREASRAALGKPTSRAAVRALVDIKRLREAPGPHSIR
jgi:N-acetylglucosaminyl-diphospho-decaprenol L-rhamnosyltransferase